MGLCAVCNAETSKRCRCKRFVCELCHKKDWANHKLKCLKRPVFHLSSQAVEFTEAVKRDGFALIRVDGITNLMRKVVEFSRLFFGLDFEQKRSCGAGPGPGQQHGFMDLQFTEVFEVKTHYDKRFSWPSPEMERCVMDLHNALRDASIKALEVLCKDALKYLDQDKDHVDFATCSNSALRILLYSKPSKDKDIPTNHVFATGTHTDNR